MIRAAYSAALRALLEKMLLALLLLLLACGSARADRHYLLIFGAQTHPKIPRFTHTFCTLVKVADPSPGCTGLPLEVHTISWLPATLKIKPYRLHPEPGYNLTLEETLNWTAQNNMRVSLWGPYAITERFYGRVYQEYARFESGEYLYHAIDGTRRGDIAADCIHAVTDIDRQDSRLRFLVLRSGDPVTRKFVRVLRDQGNLYLPPEDVSWLDAALRLDCYGVRHRPNP
jgi:hypothetical protein